MHWVSAEIYQVPLEGMTPWFAKLAPKLIEGILFAHINNLLLPLEVEGDEVWKHHKKSL